MSAAVGRYVDVYGIGSVDCYYQSPLVRVWMCMSVEMLTGSGCDNVSWKCLNPVGVGVDTYGLGECHVKV